MTSTRKTKIIGGSKLKILTHTKEALRAIPGVVTAIFILSVVSMNLLANGGANQ